MMALALLRSNPFTELEVIVKVITYRRTRAGMKCIVQPLSDMIMFLLCQRTLAHSICYNNVSLFCCAAVGRVAFHTLSPLAPVSTFVITRA